MRLIAVLSLAGLTALIMMAAPPPDSRTDEATTGGQKWLALLDDQKYEESWKQADPTFREQVKQDDWVAALKQSRGPLGRMVSRVAARIDFTKTLRGAPDGDYCIIHFTTGFENKAVTERLTLVLADGKWQASAYAIH